MKSLQRQSGYYKPLIKLAVPIIAQNLLSSAVSSMDVVMLNFVGQDAISAVSLASQITTILFMFFYGLGTGATMLCAQYYGKGDTKAICVVEGLAMRFSVSISVAFGAAALFAPRFLMLIFTNDPALIGLGVEYLRYVSAAYVCWGFTEVYLSVLRSIGRVTTAMYLNIAAFTLNIIFNAVFIFGFFGAPRLGAAGVALGTTLSRVTELVLCVIVSARSDEIKLDPRFMFIQNKVLLADFVKMALPAMMNDIVWGLAFSVYSIILGHLGTDAVAANSLASVVRNFGSVMCFGVASAGGILVGQIMGENRLEESREAAKDLVKLTFISAAIGAALILISTPFVIRFADLSPAALTYLKWMLLINVYYIFGPALNTTLICGVFRAGGDSKYGLFVDIVDMWCYAVPLSLLCAFVLKLPVMWVYVIMCTDEFVKWPFVIRHYRSGKWVKNITREEWN